MAKKSKQAQIIDESVLDPAAEATRTAAMAAQITRAFGALGFSPMRQGSQHGLVQEYAKEYIEPSGVRTLLTVVLDTGLSGATPIAVRSFVVTRQSRIDPDVERLLGLPQSEPVRDMVSLLNAINGPGEVVNAITVRCAVCNIETAEFRPLPDGRLVHHNCATAASAPAASALTLDEEDL